MTFPESDPANEADPNADTDESAGVTLDQLHEELIAASTETRRGNRRMLDVLKNFGTVLDALSSTVNDTHKALRAFPAGASARPPEGGELPHEWALALAELADRIARVDEGFSRPPPAAFGWWPGSRKTEAAWKEAWAMQTDALGILGSHMEVLLARAGLVRLAAVGEAFDPATMTAVESAVDAGKPDHTVLAELSPGWRHAATGELLRPAQVRVSRHPAD